MPRTIQLVLDDDLARRLEERLAAEGGDGAALLERALRAHLDAGDEAAAARDAVIRAAGEGEFGTAPGLSADHARVRLWLLGWGGDGESGPPGSC
ncbi:transcriptional regulator [Paramagnetospirillum caucaseum]|nr:transcriptional regulator [Paramagnetospirillum caucaseum]